MQKSISSRWWAVKKFFFATSNLIFFHPLPSFRFYDTQHLLTKGVSKMRNFTGKLRLNDASFFFQSSHIFNIYNTISYWEYFFLLLLLVLLLFSKKKDFQIREIKRNSNSSPAVLTTSNIGAVFSFILCWVCVLKLLHVASYVIVSHSLPHLFSALNFCLNVLFF